MTTKYSVKLDHSATQFKALHPGHHDPLERSFILHFLGKWCSRRQEFYQSVKFISFFFLCISVWAGTYACLYMLLWKSPGNVENLPGSLSSLCFEVGLL